MNKIWKDFNEPSDTSLIWERLNENGNIVAYFQYKNGEWVVINKKDLKNLEDTSTFDSLINGAPEELDTLGEIATALSSKEDKISGKGLSTNDFTNANKEAVEQSLPLGVQMALDRTQDMDTIRSGAAAGATAYQKPQAGIPATDLAILTSSLAAVPADTSGVVAILIETLGVTSEQLSDLFHGKYEYIKFGSDLYAVTYAKYSSDFSYAIFAGKAKRYCIWEKWDGFMMSAGIDSYESQGYYIATAIIINTVSYNRSWVFKEGDIWEEPASGSTPKQMHIYHNGAWVSMDSMFPDVSGKADKVNNPTSGNFAGLDANGNLTDSGKKASDFATAAQGAKADTAIQDLSPITDLIPAQASDQNQLADKAFVNSSIATATATFRGSYNLVTDLSLTTATTRAQIATALAGAVSTADNNDYCFVQIPTADATSSEIARVDRYKFDGTAWAYEWSLNNSSFTAAQWAAINSGITAALVTTFRNKYDKPSGGIPASDLASGVIPTIESLTNAEIDTIWNTVMA